MHLNGVPTHMNYTKVLTLAVGAVVGSSLVAYALGEFDGHAHVWLTDSLVGTKILNEQGDTVGKIEDIVVSPRQASSYVVVSLASWAAMPDKLLAIPWTVIRTIEPDPQIKDSQRTLALTVDKATLRTAPSFASNAWPDMTESNWGRDVDAFYHTALTAKGADKRPANESRPAEAAARNKVITWKSTDLQGADVMTKTKEKLGDIEEVAVDTDGRFCYVAISVGGFLGIGERMVAVPWDALQFSLAGAKNDTKLITLDSTKEQLGRAPEYSNADEDRARMCDPEWIKSVYDHFSIAPYWNTNKASKASGTVGK